MARTQITNNSLLSGVALENINAGDTIEFNKGITVMGMVSATSISAVNYYGIMGDDSAASTKVRSTSADWDLAYTTVTTLTGSSNSLTQAQVLIRTLGA